MVEVIKHLENPWHTLRQVKSLLKEVELIFISMPMLRICIRG